MAKKISNVENSFKAQSNDFKAQSNDFNALLTHTTYTLSSYPTLNVTLTADNISRSYVINSTLLDITPALDVSGINIDALSISAQNVYPSIGISISAAQPLPFKLLWDGVAGTNVLSYTVTLKNDKSALSSTAITPFAIVATPGSYSLTSGVTSTMPSSYVGFNSPTMTVTINGTSIRYPGAIVGETRIQTISRQTDEGII